MSRFFLSILLLFLIFFAQAQSADECRDRKALQIHKSIFTLDSHTDTPMNLFDRRFNLGEDNSATLKRSKVDLPRMAKGSLDGIFFAVFEPQGPLTPDGYVRSKQSAIRTIDSIYASVGRNRDAAMIVTSPDQAYDAKKQGRRAIFIGLENGYPLGNDLHNVELFYTKGARYITLCHTKNNDICTSSTDSSNTSRGLSDFGRQVVAEMNHLGMLIDVSHISDSAFYDVLALSKAPVIASHSCSRALCNNPRNLTDDMLRALAKNKGVAQMCILSAYVKTPEANPSRDSAFSEFRKRFPYTAELSDTEREEARRQYYWIEERFPQKLATVSDVCDHIDHMVQVAGINHVGIGTDFDGGGGVLGCMDVSGMGNITCELVKRGYSRRELRKIWGGNFFRVMHEAGKVKTLSN